jgi:pantoate--beta-alanine ligase
VLMQRMSQDLRMPVELRMGPTQREPDGVAMSSRNRYLSPVERAQAPALYGALSRVREELLAGARDFARLSADARTDLERAGLRPEYVEIRRQGDLGRTRRERSPASCSVPRDSGERGSSTTY